MAKSLELTANKLKELISNMNTTLMILPSRCFIILPWSVHKQNLILVMDSNTNLDSNTWMLQLLVMLHKQLWSSSINQLKIFSRQDLSILLENAKMVQIQKCLLTLQTNMHFLLSDKKDPTTTGSLISKEHHKKYGNIVEESWMKENTIKLTHKQRKNSKLSTCVLVKTEKEC